MTQTFLFYDLETSGLNKCFDQILQFAAIRTDLDFNELERYNFYIKLNPDVIPMPAASITHRISLKTANNGLTELEAMEKIHALFNTPGTISLGYNTLEFDDEFLRFSFYRNLLTPYTHQYANQCARMDIYPATLMYYLYNNDCIKWPNIDGAISLKLENINNENQLAQGQAHDAMVDIEATLALTKIFAQDAKMWRYVSGYFQKKTDLERMLQLPTYLNKHREAILLNGKFGAKHNFQVPAISLGEHRHYRNQTIWLRLDLPALQETTPESVEKTTWAISKKWGETPFLLPPLERFMGKIDSKRKALAEKNKAWLKKNPDCFQAIIDYHLDYTHPVNPHTDVDAALYIADFWSREDVNACQHFHASKPDNRINTLSHFTRDDLKTLALRALAKNAPATLSPAQQALFQAHLNAIYTPHNPPHDFRGESHVTPEKALAEIQKLREQQTLDKQQRILLDEIETHLDNKQPLDTA